MKIRIPGLILVSFLTDRITKQQVELGLLKEQTLLGGRVMIEKHHNRGLALGVKREEPQEAEKLALFGVAATAIVYCLTDKRKKRLTKAGLAMMLGGGLGNLYDRYRQQAVTDFLRIPGLKGKAGKVIFNVADIWILLGGLLTVIGKARRS